MVMFGGSSNHSGRNERTRFLRFNLEHCEMYWQMAYADSHDDVTVLLIDCTDPVGLMIAHKLVGEARTNEVAESCRRRGMIPTLHAAISTDQAIAFLEATSPSFVDALVRCPHDCFPILVIADGGKSLAYRERPITSGDTAAT